MEEVVLCCIWKGIFRNTEDYSGRKKNVSNGLEV